MTYNYNRRLAYPFYSQIKPEMLGKARELRKNMTQAEQLLWKRIRHRALVGSRFRRQHPINRFIADFYCHDAKLIIEVDGLYHLKEDQKEYDEGRTAELSELGIEVIRFTNEEIESDIERVIDKIKEKLYSRLQTLQSPPLPKLSNHLPLP